MANQFRPTPAGATAAVAVAMCCLLPFFISGNPYPAGLVTYWVIGGGAALVVTVIAMRAGVVERLWAALGAAVLRPSPVAFAGILALVATVLALVFVVYAFDSGVSTADEVALLWHAKMLAHGFLALPADPNPEFFAIDNVIDAGKWYSMYPIGGVVALLPGVLIGMPFLVNPVCAGLSAAAFSHFARVAFGEREGRAAAVTFAVMPNVLLMSGTYLNHVPTLLCATLALAAVAEWERASTAWRGARWAAAVGAAVAGAATIRPLDAVVLAGVIGAFQLFVVARDRSRARELAVQAVAGLVVLAPLLYANWATNGDPFRFGYEVLWGPGHRIGFHADPQGSEHTPSRGLFYAITYVSELNGWAMAWPMPAMVVAFVGLAALKPFTKWDGLVVGFFFAQVAAYAAYWGRGEFLGPRFLFTALPALAVILARTPFRVAAVEGTRSGQGLATFLLACTAIAWGPAWSDYSAWGLADVVRSQRRAMRFDVLGAVRGAGIHNALVFVREDFATRLQRRLWGVGVGRARAAQLLGEREVCSLLAAVRRAEADTSASAVRAMLVERDAAPLPVATADSLGRVVLPPQPAPPPECLAEADRSPPAIGGFAAALPLEPIDAEGRVNGDVIYVFDLGDHNEALRERFGDRTWYRLLLDETPDGTLSGRVVPY